MDEPKRLFRDRRGIPPIPPGVEQLRAAAGSIDPERFYSAMMPDGTEMVMKGSAMLKTAGLLVALADADAAGDDEAIVRAVEAIVAGPTLVVCTRVGRAAGPIPPGTLTADCGWCGAAVWVTANNHARATGPGGRVVCSECVCKAAGGRETPG
jgi:hypothetical protein